MIGEIWKTRVRLSVVIVIYASILRATKATADHGCLTTADRIRLHDTTSGHILISSHTYNVVSLLFVQYCKHEQKDFFIFSVFISCPFISIKNCQDGMLPIHSSITLPRGKEESN